VQEILFSEEWQAYRELEIKVGARIIHRIWNDNADPSYLKGAIDMLRMMLQIPTEMAKTDEAKAAAAALIQTAMHKVDMDLLRKMMAGETP
jgi:hypothetical protein